MPILDFIDIQDCVHVTKKKIYIYICESFAICRPDTRFSAVQNLIGRHHVIIYRDLRRHGGRIPPTPITIGHGSGLRNSCSQDQHDRVVRSRGKKKVPSPCTRPRPYSRVLMRPEVTHDYLYCRKANGRRHRRYDNNKIKNTFFYFTISRWHCSRSIVRDPKVVLKVANSRRESCRSHL